MHRGVTRTPECRCLACGKVLDALGTQDGKAMLPEPGNLAVCFYCGAVMIIADDLTVRGMTDDEMDDVIADREAMNEIAKLVVNMRLIRAQVN